MKLFKEEKNEKTITTLLVFPVLLAACAPATLSPSPEPSQVPPTLAPTEPPAAARPIPEPFDYDASLPFDEKILKESEEVDALRDWQKNWACPQNKEK